jgi:multidrug efflux pump subunit AcrA (membrane-fusion protein)
VSAPEIAGAGGPFDRESEVLSRDLPPRVSRGIAELLILLFLAAIGFVLLVKLPMSVTGRFVLEAKGGSDPVNAAHGGVVERVAVQVGSPVHEGDTLLVIRADDLRQLAAERIDLATRVAEAQRSMAATEGGTQGTALAARVESLGREVAAARAIKEESQARYEAQLREADADARRLKRVADARADRVKSLQALVDKHQTLAEEGVVAQADVLERQELLGDAEAELQTAVRDQQQASGGGSRIMTEHLVESAQQEAALAKLEGELAEASASRATEEFQAKVLLETGPSQLEAMDRVLTTAEGDAWHVQAPYDGVVVALDVERPGISVERGQRLALIARGSVHLLASIAVPEGEAARISEGQTVRLMLDAYPYTRHGIVPATLSWVSPAAVEGTVPALAELRDTTILVDGLPRALQVGLGGSARIDTGRATTLQFVLSPLRQLRQQVSAGPDGSARAPLPAGPRPASATSSEAPGVPPARAP